MQTPWGTNMAAVTSAENIWLFDQEFDCIDVIYNFLR